MPCLPLFISFGKAWHAKAERIEWSGSWERPEHVAQLGVVYQRGLAKETVFPSPLPLPSPFPSPKGSPIKISLNPGSVASDEEPVSPPHYHLMEGRN